MLHALIGYSHSEYPLQFTSEQQARNLYPNILIFTYYPYVPYHLGRLCVGSASFRQVPGGLSEVFGTNTPAFPVRNHLQPPASTRNMPEPPGTK